jgi:hypothetical protein
MDSFFPGNLIPLSEATSLPCDLSNATRSQFCDSDQQFSPPDKVIGIRENH